ncbi:PREDICTED: uncharacterized protein LOC109133354 [Camelina sativa]|uniref:Uncharacterized protein LOC109133354 n=1 Tax=Camelina sativa TaxID=90675 RepID=A0ABM1RSE2_CAMSA|nr:PREDICTED: uncharacterized protein LOC109133354 [Camelina sativa]
MAPHKPAVESELESNATETSVQPMSLEQRIDNHEKILEFLKVSVEKILWNQTYGVIDSATPGFSSPVPAVQQHTVLSPVIGSASVNREGILPLPPRETQLRPSELHYNTPPPDPRSSMTRGYSEYNKLVELPYYEGSNPDDWLFRVEKCFERNNTPESEWINQAVSHMTGSAVTWWRWVHERLRIRTWKDFCERFKSRFGAGRGQPTLDHLLSITQQGSVEDYRERFEELAVELPHVSDDVLEAAFLKGLKRSIRDQVVRMRPLDMTKLVDGTKLIESQENEKASYHARVAQRHSSTGQFVNESSSFKKTGDYSRDTRKAVTSGEPKITNPCRYCGDRWVPGHRCKQQKLKSLEVEEEEFFKVEDTGDDQEELQEIVTLSGSNVSNFISERVVKELQLPVTSSKRFGVRVAGGQILKGQGKCAGQVLNIQGIQIVGEFRVFDLGTSTDVILGYSWLDTLGDTRINWLNRTLSWKIGVQWVTIVGDPDLSRGQVSINSMERIIKKKGVAYLLELTTLLKNQGQPNKKTDQIDAVNSVVSHYKEVFAMPAQLPPTRNREHAIILRSPVLLVKKRDGGWRFCVDYRELNNATVLDRYPIPVIEELLDELQGATIFSKLDLKSGYHQIWMKSPDVEKTAFRTHQGHYEFFVMPFGLTNAPSTFQCIMNDLFRPYLRKFVLVFFDDILIYSPNLAEHLTHLELVLELMPQHKFVANEKKCSFKLLKKNNFSWTEAATTAFNNLKQAVTTIPVLALPDFKKKFTVETDASGVGIGAVLSQNKRPIAFLSQAFSSTGRTKSVYERELLAIVKVVSKWKHYLTGLNYRIEYKPGVENKVADALSRRPVIEELMQLSLAAPVNLDKEELRVQVQADAELGPIMAKLEQGIAIPDYSLEKGMLLRQGSLVIPRGSPFIPKLLEQFHASKVGGHEGALKTYKRLISEVTWRGMRKDVLQFVTSCQIWSDISLDFVEGLPNSKGFNSVLVVVDRLSKYSHFIGLKHSYTAKTVAEAFIREVVKLHGFPESMVSDRDRIFLSNFWYELFKLQGTN